MAEQPAKAVTFVECHDYEYGRDYDSHVQEWIKPLAYAFTLLRAQGYPVVFYPDLYGSAPKDEHAGQPSGGEYLELLLRLRQQFALGEERFYGGGQQIGWVRIGGYPGCEGRHGRCAEQWPRRGAQRPHGFGQGADASTTWQPSSSAAAGSSSFATVTISSATRQRAFRRMGPGLLTS